MAATTALWAVTTPPPHPAPAGSTGQVIAAGVVIGVAVLIAWQISLRTHPWTSCPTCKGDPRNYHPLFRRYFGLCPRCGGSGRVLRKGAKDPKG